MTCNDFYEESGGLGRLLAAAPALEKLASPSAPESGFFMRKSALRDLAIHVGYDHCEFLKQLGESDCFSQLATLRYVDYSETHVEDFENGLTPREHFVALFESEALPNLRKLSLVNARLANEQELRAMPLALQLEELEFGALEL